MGNAVQEREEHDVILDADKRLVEIAQVLAEGILRLSRRMALSADSGQFLDQENVREKSQDSLELPDKTVLSVHTGKRFPRPDERTTR
jgi:hypothetical protein